MKKKTVVLFTLAVLLVTAIWGVWGLQLLGKMQQTEIFTVQDIAGAVLSEYPAAETALMEGVLDEEHRYREAGDAFLAKYGYGTAEDLWQTADARQIRGMFFAVLGAFAAAALLGGYGFLYLVWRKQKQREAAVVYLLDHCLSDDYRVLNEEEHWRDLDSSLLEDQLRKLGERLRLKTEDLTAERDNTKTLVTDLSHQLKTPLSALRTCLQMYWEAEALAEKEEFRGRIQNQVRRLEELMASLIQISRLETGLIALRPETVTMGELLIGAVNTVYPKGKQKGIALVTEPFSDFALCMDKKWTVEAIANLLDNGIKYSPAGSEIHLSVRKRYQFVRLEVEDAGIGIPDAERNLIFQRFYRGGDKTVREKEGTGVGLYLTRKILEEQGGTVTVKGGKERGSVFVVQLPLLKENL